ncbi:MAG: hypothetical protein DDT34_01872 [Firmicutes bacterium]|nr:hypothetical protein [Bacillota bacterium]
MEGGGFAFDKRRFARQVATEKETDISNLGQTVIQLVNNSPAGLTTMEIEGLLDIPLKSFLSHFRSVEQLCRERVGNLFVYFSSDEEILARQKQKRQEVDASAGTAELPTDTEAIVILVERIKNHLRFIVY